MLKKKLFALFAAALTPLAAHACEYEATIYGVGNPSWLRQVVTDSYCKKFPSSKYQIVILNSKAVIDGTGYGTAIAFISPKFKDQDLIKPITSRYSSTFKGNGNVSESDLNNLAHSATVDAVHELMIDISPTKTSRSNAPTSPAYSTTTYYTAPQQNLNSVEESKTLPLPGQPGYCQTFPQSCAVEGNHGSPY